MGQNYWDLYYLTTGGIPQVALLIIIPAILVGYVIRFLNQQ